MANVLVFGASGAVGRAAAMEARRRGAKVWLAMRDISKVVQQLDEDEKKGGYERVQADLSQPSTVTAAVEKSGATAAFVYTVFDSPDAMKSTFKALKEAGITYLILLSSSAVQDPPSATDTTEIVPRVHAHTEMALEQTGDLRSVILRPGYFSSNLFMYAQGVQKGVVEVFRPNAVFDFIAPDDIGAVAGSLLVTRDQDGVVLLNGPQLVKMQEAFGVIAQVCGKEVEVREIDEAAFLEKISFVPKAIATSLAATYKEYDVNGLQLYAQHAQAVANVEKSGRTATKLSAWVEGAKVVFGGQRSG